MTFVFLSVLWVCDVLISCFDVVEHGDGPMVATSASALPTPIAPTSQYVTPATPQPPPKVEEAATMPIIRDLDDLDKLPPVSPAPAKKPLASPVKQPTPVKQASCMLI